MRGGKLRHTLRNTGAIRRPRPGGIGAVGDSITSGQGNAPERWMLSRSSWVTQLAKGGVPYTFNAAVPNQVTSDVAAQIPTVLRYRPRAVVIVTGTNDVFEGLPLGDVADAIERMADELAAAGVAPILATLPPFDAAPAALIDFNAAVVAIGLPVIDFYAALVVDGRYAPGLDRDGLHPSIEGARVMARAAEPVVRAALA